MLVDSSRGVGKYLRTNTNGAEVDDASILTHFISDGVLFLKGMFRISPQTTFRFFF